ncbi:hypothetical protein TrST_g6468 [Triparma strigata]|uniref:Uncharacterized protein n=1 Tax=Triparma strigata TaxID=1606541 RepID=A0A9W6ZS58_9STRA|nr:hypothetical protein TrST_g6468 [Triparma strigata]
MLPNLGEGTVSELAKGRKKMGKTWGKFKRATGIKKPKKDGSAYPQDMTSDGPAANNTFQSLTVSSNYDENLRTLVNFYEVWNPEKVVEAKSILDAYKGKEEMLFRRLEDLQINRDGTEDGRGYDREQEAEQQQQLQEQQFQEQQQQLKMPPASEFTSNATMLFNSDVPEVGGDGGGMNPFSFDDDHSDESDQEEGEEDDDEGQSSSEEETHNSGGAPLDFFNSNNNINDDLGLLSPDPITSDQVTSHLDNIFGGTSIEDSPFGAQLNNADADAFGDVAEQMRVASMREPAITTTTTTTAPAKTQGDAFDVMGGDFDVLKMEKELPAPAKKKPEPDSASFPAPPRPPPGPPPQSQPQVQVQAHFSDSDSSDAFSDSEEEEEESSSEEEPSPEKQQKKKKKSKQLLSLASKALKGTGKIAKYTAKAATATLSTTTTSSSKDSPSNHSHGHGHSSSGSSNEPIPTKSEIIDILNNFHLQGAGSLPHNAIVLAVSNSRIPPSSTFSFMWYKQAVNSTNLQLIPNLTTPTYQPNASDLNHTIHCKLKVHPHLLPNLYPMPLSDKFAGTPPLFPAVNVKTRVVAALETGQMNISSLELKASTTNSSLQLQPLPSSLPASNITVSLDSDDKLKISSADSDTPRGLLLDLSASPSPLLTVDPVNVNRLDVTPAPDSVEWYGDVGGELWQFHQMLEGVKAQGQMSQQHFTLHFNFVNSSKEARDVFFLVSRHKSNSPSWLLPWDEEGSERGSGGGDSTPDSGQRFERRDSLGSTPMQEQEEADNGLLAQMITMKKELDDIKAEEKKKQKRYSHLKQQLEVTEEQLEQVSEAFDELSNSKQDSEASTNAMITALEDENERLESSEKSKNETIENLREDLEAANSEIKKLQHQLSSKPAALYKSDSPSPLPPSSDVSEKYRLEATIWKRKYDSIQKDMKKVLKTSVSSSKLKSLEKQNMLMSDDLIAHKKALDHALGQLDEMRLREIQLLGTSFEFAPRPKPKSYVRVARNIVKMRKATASKGKKVIKEVGSAVRRVRNKARKSSLLKKSKEGGRRKSEEKVRAGAGGGFEVGNNGHVFSDSDDSSESDEEEEVVFEHMEGGGDNLKLEFEREA